MRSLTPGPANTSHRLSSMSYKLVDIVCADDIGLPPQLVGSPRQIAWAEDVRIKIAIQMEKVRASFLAQWERS